MATSPYARDLELYVRCRSCGFPLASGLRRRPDEAPLAEGRTHRCPRCGSSRRYAPVEYAWREDLDGAGVEPGR